MMSIELDIELPEMAKQWISSNRLAAYGRMAASQMSPAELQKHCPKERLESLDAQSLLGQQPRDQMMAKCCLAGVWLLHGYLDESHQLSQAIKTGEGSYWHGLMHRLEGDFWNSKYWYRNVGRHPVLERLQANQGASYPDSFVDDCENVATLSDPGSELVSAVAATAIEEWKLLFEHCFELATF